MKCTHCVVKKQYLPDLAKILPTNTKKKITLKIYKYGWCTLNGILDRLEAIFFSLSKYQNKKTQSFFNISFFIIMIKSMIRSRQNKKNYPNCPMKNICSKIKVKMLQSHVCQLGHTLHQNKHNCELYSLINK